MLFEPLAYSRAAVDAGQWWRLATASVAHLSLAHLAINLAAAVLLGLALRGRLSSREAAGVTVAGAILVGAGIHGLTRLDWYAGLSGALWALAAYGAGRVATDPPRSGVSSSGPGGVAPDLPASDAGRRRRERVVATLLLSAMAAGAALDQRRTASWLGEPLAPQAHLIGFAAGAVLVFVRRIWLGRRAARPRPLSRR